MLALVANTIVSREPLMDTPDALKKDHAQDLPLLSSEITDVCDAFHALREEGREPFVTEVRRGKPARPGSRFLTVLLRALAAWPA